MDDMDLEIPLQKVAFVGSFLPRRSRTAAETTYLCNTFAAEFNGCACLRVAASDVQRGYPYPSQIRFEIAQARPEDYRAAAVFLNLNDVDLVCIQHDFDIFGGEGSSYILELVRGLKPPVVTAFSRVPASPSPAQRETIQELGSRSCRLVVFDRQSIQALEQTYGIPREKIETIAAPDGLPGEGTTGEHTNAVGVYPAGSDSPVWRDLAQKYMQCFQRGRQAEARRTAQRASEQQPVIPVTGNSAADLTDRVGGMETVVDGGAANFQDLPALKLDHFLRMRDETGMLKASVISLPDYRQGYSTADNARALMFSLLLEQVGEGPFIPIEMQASRHLAFLWNAFNPERGRFRETMTYTRIWQDDEGTEDTQGLVLWALGMTLRRTAHPGMQGVARQLFEAALPTVKQLSSLRAWAFSLLGIQEYLAEFSGDRAVVRTGKLLLDRLVHQYQERSAPDWPWFEEAVSGSDVIVAQAMIASAQWANDPRAVEIGLKTLHWLAELQFTGDGMFTPLGDQGNYRRGGKRARFAQRPVDARGMISADLEAYRLTGDERWLRDARSAFQWFLGRNDLGQPLYDPETGGCCDGLLPGRADPNYSSQALLAFLMAQLEMRLFDQLYRRRSPASPQLPILQISSPRSIIRHE